MEPDLLSGITYWKLVGHQSETAKIGPSCDNGGDMVMKGRKNVRNVCGV